MSNNDDNKSELQTLTSESNGKSVGLNYQDILKHIEVQCSVRIGQARVNLADIKNLNKGQLLQLEEDVASPVDVLIQQKVIARGELMNIDDHFAVKITEVNL